MTRVQIVEYESLLKYADYENCEVWLLNTPRGEVDERCIVVKEITDSTLPNREKFPAIMTELIERHPSTSHLETVSVEESDDNGNTLFDENGNVRMHEVEMEVAELGFDYEVITRSKDNFSVSMYICDEQKIREVKI